MNPSYFPHRRPRRLRRSHTLRDVLADVHIPPQCLVMPVFVCEADQPRDVPAMPGVQQWPVDHAVQQILSLTARGLKQFILFGVTPPEKKDATGSYAASPDCPVNRTLAALRDRDLDAILWADLCFCEYTSHGHCGCLIGDGSDPAVVDNDATLEMLGTTAIAQARAGAHVVAPSGMMDGQVHAIRTALDHSSFTHIPICSYAIKYASHFYGPFREAGEGGMAFGDRRGYQMDFRRQREWRTELELDLAQGADMVMIKPALSYLDIIHQVRQSCDVPVAAYHVSGEYSMLHAAADRGWLDLPQAVIEVTTAIRRAGADLILTYFAPQLLEWLTGEA